MRFPILFFQIKTKNLFCQLEGAPKDWCSGTKGLVHGHHSFGALILQLSFFWIYVPFCNELLISLDHKGTGKRERKLTFWIFLICYFIQKSRGKGTIWYAPKFWCLGTKTMISLLTKYLQNISEHFCQQDKSYMWGIFWWRSRSTSYPVWVIRWSASSRALLPQNIPEIGL